MRPQRKIAVVLIVGSVFVWLIDLFSRIASTGLGKIYCGNRYMQPVDGGGVVGDVSCGFNADMYLIAFLFVVFAVGVLLFVISASQ